MSITLVFSTNGRRVTRKPSAKSSPPKKEAKSSGKPQLALGIENLIGYNLRRAHGVQMHRFRSAFAPHSIRPVQLSILGLIYENPGLKQSDLGRALQIERTNIVALLAQLERRRLIERRTGPSDRRARLLQLTAAGRKLTAELLEKHDRLERDLAKRLGVDERDVLLALLKKFRALPASFSDDDE